MKGRKPARVPLGFVDFLLDFNLRVLGGIAGKPLRKVEEFANDSELGKRGLVCVADPESKTLSASWYLGNVDRCGRVGRKNVWRATKDADASDWSRAGDIWFRVRRRRLRVTVFVTEGSIEVIAEVRYCGGGRVVPSLEPGCTGRR